MCTLSSFVKQGTLAELEIDKTGEEQHRVLQARLSQQQPLKKKKLASVVSLLPIQPAAFF